MFSKSPQSNSLFLNKISPSSTRDCTLETDISYAAVYHSLASKKIREYGNVAKDALSRQTYEADSVGSRVQDGRDVILGLLIYINSTPRLMRFPKS